MTRTKREVDRSEYRHLRKQARTLEALKIAGMSLLAFVLFMGTLWALL